MCGIIAVLARPSTRPTPDPDVVDAVLARALAVLHGPDGSPLERLRGATPVLAEADALLRGVPGVLAFARSSGARHRLLARLDALDAAAAGIDRAIEAASAGVAPDEAVNAALVADRDLRWALRRDRLRTIEAVADLAGGDADAPALAALWSVQVALAALDRLEVRGRDSAGLHLLVHGHGLDVASPHVRRLLDGRVDDPLFTHRAVRVADGCLAFVYKAAAEIGELGDNTRTLRDAVRADELLRLALRSPGARVQVLGHTRWASVGIISEANAHPLTHEELGRQGPFVVGALNGDVDNHADLKALEGLAIDAAITTDAKVIPALVSRRAADGHGLTEAFRRTVASFEGSVAIAAQASAEPDRMLLALRGSGQALYVGVAEDAFVVASEPYGVIEETGRYLRLDGETPARPDAPSTSRGQVVVLDAAGAGTLAGIHRVAYDGTVLPIRATELVRAEITTRDIDRGAFPHFLLKEISEAPRSFATTLRGRIVDAEPAGSGDASAARPRVVLGDAAFPPAVAAGLASGRFRRVVVIGQGTAAVAGQGVAAVLAGLLGPAAPLAVEATTATELSGFGMVPDFSDTLIVAISQSGTTTDTNRTVDLVRGRGATVIAIVNRRGSDLCDKADGVLFTSDGRDVEMSVASTKAFYAQVAAGSLLAAVIAECVAPEATARARAELCAGLRELPAALTATLAERASIAQAAHTFAPARRYWAVVGNGRNRVAAAEVRIKLSELCYKSIACDATEDKKHIDLSSEPLILVCAAGLSGSTADDVAKEVDIYRAHKATPIVVATRGEERFRGAVHVIEVPPVAPELAFIVSAMAGHLFGYEAALAIDAQARSLREVRAAVEAVVSAAHGRAAVDLMSDLTAALAPVAGRVFDLFRSGQLDGHLEASTAVRLASVLRYAAGIAGLDAYAAEHGKIGTPTVVVDDLLAALTQAIDELTRPIDAIKHQAKTVTVGISRSDEGLMVSPLVAEVLAAGAPRDRLTYRVLKTLADLGPAVAGVLGSTRYRIEGDVAAGEATITVVDRSGISFDIVSRVERDPRLRGTKRRVAQERDVHVSRGAADGRTVVLVPELKGTEVTGITLLHVRLADRLEAEIARGVLSGYRGRYASLVDYVTETEPAFRDDLLATVDVVDLLTLPILDLVPRWRS